MKVYLAGGFYGSWKNVIKSLAPTPKYYDPELDSKQSSISEYVTDDLKGLDEADIVVARLDNYPKYGGTAAEMGYAYARCKKILFLCEKDEPDGFLVGLCSKIYTNPESLAIYLEKLATERPK